ncbi:MAG: hypothetical protein V4864_21910 [Pseudomonadota bacterium]
MADATTFCGHCGARQGGARPTPIQPGFAGAAPAMAVHLVSAPAPRQAWPWLVVSALVVALGSGAGYMVWRSKVAKDDADRKLVQLRSERDRQIAEEAALRAATIRQSTAGDTNDQATVELARAALARHIEEEEKLARTSLAAN